MCGPSRRCRNPKHCPTVLGRGLSTASSDETQQVSAASAALSAGSSLIASQIGAKLGLTKQG